MLFDICDLVALRMAYKRNDASCYIEKIQDQFAAGEKEFHEIRLYRTADDCYNELWYEETEEGKRKFYIRHTCGLPFFAYVCDPLGYCEMDHSVADNVIFIILSEDGEREIFGVSNLHGANFPTLEETCRREWNRIKADYPHFDENSTADWWSQTLGNGTTNICNMWLLTFMDPVQYEKEIKDMYGYEENWVMRMKTVGRELIGGFQYLGKDYYIIKEIKEHTVCGKRVIEYWVDDKIILGEWDSHVLFLSDYCEGKPGPMYPEREAVNVVEKALRKIYEEKQISEIHDSYGYIYELFIGYKDAAKRLLNGNYNRKRVCNLIATERQNHSFWCVDDPEIEVKYPGCVRDHSWNYDFLGRRY